jgi:hypothetical protein
VFTSRQSGGVPKWSSCLERGFSQLVDWFWKLDDVRQTEGFREEFGTNPTFTGLLLLGRRETLGSREQARLEWRERNVLIGGRTVQCMTYDDLLDNLVARLSTYRYEV